MYLFAVLIGTIKAPAVEEAEFPSLGAAVTTKETKKKKKQTMSLGEFVTGGAPVGGSRGFGGMMDLPKAPRTRSGEDGEDGGPMGSGPKLGGGFRGGYGGGGRFGGDRRAPRRMEEEEEGPSRADAVDSWGAERKFTPSDGLERRSMGGVGQRSRDEREPGGPSRADMVDDWGATRQFKPSSPKRRGGFNDSFGPSRGRDTYREPARADIEEKWERREDAKPTAFEDRPPRTVDERRRGFADSWRGSRPRSRDGSFGNRSRDVSQENTWRREAPVEHTEPPKERPKLVLKPRTAPLDDVAAPISDDGKRSSVFGAARPREEVLKEQGRDPVKEDIILEEKVSVKHGEEEKSRLHKELESLKSKAGAPDLESEEKNKLEEQMKDIESKLAKLDVKENAALQNGGTERRPRKEHSGSHQRDRRGPPMRRDSGQRW